MAAWLQAIKPRLLYVITGLVIGALVAGTIATYLAEKATARTQTRILTAAGWTKAKVDKHPEAAAPEIDTGPLEVAKMEPVAGGRFVTKVEYIPIPQTTLCPVDTLPPVLPEPGGQAPSPLAPPPLELQIEGQFLAGLSARKDLFIEGRLWADLAMGDWAERRELSHETIDLRISPALQKALRRGTKKRWNLVPNLRNIRTGWVAGGGACFGYGGPEPCFFVGYAVQF
jgi:hypothetical protein